jgi:leader peptidase (prepilin peptidase) / N-methyltransferase
MPQGLVIFAVAALGLIVGSFLNVCIYRLPKRVSVVWPASRCAECDRPLAWYENVPLVSYAVLRGRCRTCGARISLRYPLVEAITMCVFLLHWLIWGPQLILIPRLLFACALIVLFAIDLEHQILPNAITLPGIIVGLLCSLAWPPGLLASLAGVAFGGGILWLIAEVWLRLRGVEAMGFGDVKMLAMVGAFLGIKLVALTFVLSSLIGGVIGIIVIASRRGSLATAVPFGTMLAAAALIASLQGDALIRWYLSLYGR